MSFCKWTLFLILALAVMGCIQNPPSTAQGPTPSTLVENTAPDRPLPFSVRLGDTVDVEYTLSVGSFVVETTNRDLALQSGIPNAAEANYTPLSFIVGYSEVIISIEEAVQGMRVDENKIVQVPPEKGFGLPKENLVRPYPKESFGEEVKVGFLVFDPDKNPVGKIVKLNETHAWLDANHPLAGKTLTLNLTVLKIQPPRQIESEHAPKDNFSNRV